MGQCKPGKGDATPAPRDLRRAARKWKEKRERGVPKHTAGLAWVHAEGDAGWAGCGPRMWAFRMCLDITVVCIA